MQLSCEVFALIFLRRLQVVGEHRKPRRSLTHLFLEANTFACEQFALDLLRRIESLGLAQVQMKRKQSE